MCKLILRLNLVVHMGEIFELGMVICFGISWPLSVYKSYKARTTLGKSLIFELFIWIGYVSAITGKLTTQNITYVFFFYILNIVMVSIDICLYFRNRRLDRLAGRIS